MIREYGKWETAIRSYQGDKCITYTSNNGDGMKQSALL